MKDYEKFREETRSWLEANCPASQRQPVIESEQIWAGRDQKFHNEEARQYFEAMRDRGWTAPDWPAEYGGGGLDNQEAKILSQEMARLNCRPPLYDMGIWMLGPALLAYGSEQQKLEHIPRIVRGEVRWAQGYSEPAAGSDLASLKTKAEDCGDHFLVNGTKIWTTKADCADWIFCLVRTDPNAAKQAGISFLLIDMHSEGVSTAPIKLISGASSFCQTFFDNVKVPKDQLVGELNQGWAVAKELLKHERKLMSSMSAMVENEQESIAELAKKHLPVEADGKLSDGAIRRDIARHLMNQGAQELLNERLYHQAKAKAIDPRLGMTIKHIGTAELQRKDELLLEILGNRGLSWENSSTTENEHAIVKNWAYDKAHTIAGGTSEIQLNIIAKRALGLPG